MSRDIRITARDGGAFEAYLALPPAPPAPGLVLLPPIYGIEPVIRRLADAYAERGYAVLVPNQFWRDPDSGPLERSDSGRAAGLARAQRVDVEQAFDDLAAAIDAVRAMPECSGAVSVLGLCFGGRYAYLAASRLPIAAAAAWHGTLIGRCLPETPRVPVSLHYGDEDPVAPMSEIETITAALRDVPNANVVIYPGVGHNFSIPGDAHYVPDAAQHAETTTFALFERATAPS